MDDYERCKRADMLGEPYVPESRSVPATVRADPQFRFVPAGEPEATAYWGGGKLVVQLGDQDPPFLSVGPEEVRVRGEVVADNQRLYEAIVELVDQIKARA